MFGRPKRFVVHALPGAKLKRFTLVPTGSGFYQNEDFYYTYNVYDGKTDTNLFAEPVPHNVAMTRLLQANAERPTHVMIDTSNDNELLFSSRRICKSSARYANRFPPDEPSLIEHILTKRQQV